MRLDHLLSKEHSAAGPVVRWLEPVSGGCPGGVARGWRHWLVRHASVAGRLSTAFLVVLGGCGKRRSVRGVRCSILLGPEGTTTCGGGSSMDGPAWSSNRIRGVVGGLLVVAGVWGCVLVENCTVDASILFF